MSVTRGDADSGAVFSLGGRYRYRLWRRWNEGKTVLFILLNPSTADETVLDPTLTRCRNYALRWGFGDMEVCNIFAYRSTDPMGMFLASDPVGPENDDHILTTARGADLVVIGWGVHGEFMGRGKRVLDMLLAAGVRPHCLGLTKAGNPRHPLYLPARLDPVEFIP